MEAAETQAVIGRTRQERRRLAREALKAKSNIPTIVLVECPKCKQPRHTKYRNEDGTVESVVIDTVEVRGEARLVDICQFCSHQYRRLDQEFIMRNLKQLQKAMRNRDNDKTTDKDFNIDL